MGFPTIPGRLLLAFRIASFAFGLTSLALSAASVQLTRNVPRPATGDNILFIVASSLSVLSLVVVYPLWCFHLRYSALITTAFRIITHKSRNRQTKDGMKRRFLPVATDSVVIALLLAALIYGAVTSATSTGACRPNAVEVEEGDGDDANEGSTSGTSFANNRACALTKASTGMTVSREVRTIYQVFLTTGWKHLVVRSISVLGNKAGL